MRGDRDTHIGLRARPHLRIRAMLVQRAQTTKLLWRRCITRVCQKSAALSLGNKAWVRQDLSKLGKAFSITRAISRCRLSSRARRVPRVAQLARMHLRLAAREGLLSQTSLGPGAGVLCLVACYCKDHSA